MSDRDHDSDIATPPETAAVPPAPGTSLSPDEIDGLRQEVIEALQTVYDPEIPVNIYELGLIYRADVDASGKVKIEMTLTAPGCPVAGTMPGTVQEAVSKVEGVTDIDVELVWDPPWDPSLMSEVARLELGMI